MRRIDASRVRVDENVRVRILGKQGVLDLDPDCMRGGERHRRVKIDMQQHVDLVARLARAQRMDAAYGRMLRNERTDGAALTARMAGPGDDVFALKNIQERIRLRYGEPYGITFTSRPGEGTVVEGLLPGEGAPS